MANFNVKIQISSLPGVLDPTAAAILRALPALNFQGVTNAQVGKTITFDLESTNENSAREEVEKMCQELLANPVIEVYTFEINESANA
jgi:phosphoribosylformylglycinamidine synthase PurS subunit